jgi:tRNA A37 threonylcarbamoyladenosine biosynthesis protein TsaE
MATERDPQFTEFLKDKLEHYPFAERLMDFCLERTSKPRWEDFADGITFPIQCSKGAFSLLNIIFRKRYARVWASKRSKESMDDAVSSLREFFSDDTEITPQKNDQAIGVMIRTESQCDALINWLSDLDHLKVKGESAPELFKKIEDFHVIKAMQAYENGLYDALDNMDKAHVLRHENLAYPPTTILALACEFVDQGRRLETGNFQGISPSRRFKALEAPGFEIFPKSDAPTAKELFHLVRPRHVLQAIEEFESSIEHGFGPSTQYDLIHEEKPYPPKAILGIACKFVNGGRLMKPDEFPGGEKSDCFKALEREGFKVVPKNSEETKSHDFEVEKLYPVREIISKLKELWKTNRPKSDNKYAIIHLLEAFENEKAIFRPYGPAWAASPWNRKVWVKENGEHLLPTSSERRFWLYAPGREAQVWSECWDNSYMLLGWDGIPDLTKYDSQEEIKEALVERFPENKNPSNSTLALWEFSSVMKPGDVVIAKEGKTKYIGYGLVEGEYTFDPDRDEYLHKRKVSWKKRGEWIEEVDYIPLKTLTDKTSSKTKSPDYELYVDRLIDLLGIEFEGPPDAKTEGNEKMIDKKLTDDFEHACQEAGLNYPQRLLQRFAASLLAKRFLILTGLSGSGKTKLAQAFAEWICVNKATKDPFFPGVKIHGARTTYHVKRSDRLAVEFWNQQEEGGTIKATLPREMISEWADLIEEKELKSDMNSKDIRTLVNENSQYSPQLHSFDTILKPAAFALIEARKNKTAVNCSEIIPVGADWTSNENVLGYPDGLNANTYVSTPVLDLILRAQENANLPHFLILDEMNLSHVERYFADMLSAIESNESIPLYEGREEECRKTNSGTDIPPTIRLPDNLFIIGTVNMDETTYMFSPKVLDRANVIEFRVELEDLQDYLKTPGRKPDLSKLSGQGSVYGENFVSAQDLETSFAPDFSREIEGFFGIFAKHNAEFGYRVASEASRLVAFQKLLGSENFNANFDIVIAQKFLPKLHGSRSQLEDLLQDLLLKSSGTNNESWDDEILQTENPIYPLSFDKLSRMLEKLRRDQFVSFAEA